MSAVAAGCPNRLAPASAPAPIQDPSAFVVERSGVKSLDILVRGASCAGCLGKIEGAVSRLSGVDNVRLNLSTGSLHVEWKGALAPRAILESVSSLGYGASAFDQGQPEEGRARTERSLLIAMVVAGFAAGNVMLLSEAIWWAKDISAETRALIQWLSALVSIPATAFAGRPFFISAIASVAQRKLNMDVPISLAVISALGLSLYETAVGGTHTFYDAPVMLLFFLLIGRFLDARLRRQVYSAANALAALQTATATRIGLSGIAEAVRASDVKAGDMLVISAGERLAIDAEVISGDSAADLRLVTGEVEPAATFAGQILHAGSVNLSAPLRVRAVSPASQSLMADIGRLLEAGEQRKSTYRKIADKAAELYVPYVHATAVLGFMGWMMFGAAPAQAAYIAVTVLIITCPCALALAAPLVQVVAAGRLFREGAFLASGDALERIATVDYVIFDKTGTLTLGDPVLRPEPDRHGRLELAATLARASRHPFSRAIVRAAGPGQLAKEVVEHPGQGVSGRISGRPARLGSASFVGVADRPSSALWFAIDGEAPEAFYFDDVVRPDAAETVGRLRAMGIDVAILSGDGDERVARAAAAAGVETWTARATPQSKAVYLEALEKAGRRAMMVGDGLNDAGALARAHASLATGGAVDVSRLASDCVFSGESLSTVATIIEVARAARRRMRENFAFAAIYNIVAIPIALAGLSTPLVAAIGMSASSAVVTLNAFRLAMRGRPNRRAGA